MTHENITKKKVQFINPKFAALYDEFPKIIPDVAIKEKRKK